MTLFMTRIESTTVKIEQKASPKWHLFLFMSLAECHKKNLAFDQQVLGISSSMCSRLVSNIGSSFAITRSLSCFGEGESNDSLSKVEDDMLIVLYE
jgi:hypothetical protein